MNENIRKTIANGQVDSFYAQDLSDVNRRVELWRLLLPRVELYYAAKVNPDPKIVERCVSLNTGFDAASPFEIQMFLDQGSKPENIIFANPVKTVEQLKFSKAKGVKKVTFDCVEELEKIAVHFPEAECVIRIATISTEAKYNLNEKFGAFMSQVPSMLELAKKLKIRVRGVAFHTGSGGVCASSYVDSIKNSRKVFDIA